MIHGSYNPAGNSPGRVFAPPGDPGNGLRFYPAEAPGFAGGYFLHERLPLTGANIFYSSEQDDIIVLFSGYIYNRKELSGTFNIRAGEPEPVIAARLFLLAGPGFVRHLNGDFAIFILRPGEHKSWLFRDHIGIRPLAWTIIKDNLYFSTEVNELCRSVAGGRGPDITFLTGYFRFIDLMRTPFSEVKRVPPGHWIEFSTAGAKTTRYWDPAKDSLRSRPAGKETMPELMELLNDAVAIRCDSRFCAGAHVSSGIDSGIVATLARKEYTAQPVFHGFSWSSGSFSAGELPFDERDLVKSLCGKAGINPVFSDLTPGEFTDSLNRLFLTGEYFTEDSLAKKAAGYGVNLIFSGWGGDEFISTGDMGIETDLLRKLMLRAYFRRNPVRPVKKFTRYFLQYTLFPVLGILDPGVARSFAIDAMYLKKPYRKGERRAIRNYYFHTSRRQMHIRTLRFYHLQERCETWTTMGYSRGIEYRYPLLDRRIIEFMISLPSGQLCHTNHFRPLLRILGEGILPDDVRLNVSKNDPHFSAWWMELLRHAALSVAGEVEEWSGNPDLKFIDFDLLQSDVARYRLDPASVDSRALFRALIYIKAVHKFSETFRAPYP